MNHLTENKLKGLPEHEFSCVRKFKNQVYKAYVT